jgi:hypothetical protein
MGNQSIYLISMLTLKNTVKGEFTSSLRIDVEHGRGASESFQIWARGNVQPPLQLWDKKLEFGIRAVHCRHVSLKFLRKLMNINLSFREVKLNSQIMPLHHLHGC